MFTLPDTNAETDTDAIGFETHCVGVGTSVGKGKICVGVGQCEHTISVPLLLRGRSCGKVMFLHLSVILFTGGGLCQGDPLPPRIVKSGRYASYWNAFLSDNVFLFQAVNTKSEVTSTFCCAGTRAQPSHSSLST